MPRISQIQVRRDSTANWTSANPVLAVGEFGLDNFTKELKVGTNYTAWNSLPAFTASGLATGSVLATANGGTNRTDGAAPPFSYGSVGANRTFTLTSNAHYVPMFGTSAITTTVAPPTVYGVKVTSGNVYEVELLWLLSITGTGTWQTQWDLVSTAGGLVTNPSTVNAVGAITNYFQLSTSTNQTATTVGYGSQWLASRPSNSTVTLVVATGTQASSAGTSVVTRFQTKAILKATSDFYVNPMLHLTGGSGGSVTTYAGSFLKVTPVGTDTSAGTDITIGSWT